MREIVRGSGVSVFGSKMAGVVLAFSRFSGVERGKTSGSSLVSVSSSSSVSERVTERFCRRVRRFVMAVKVRYLGEFLDCFGCMVRRFWAVGRHRCPSG